MNETYSTDNSYRTEILPTVEAAELTAAVRAAVDVLNQGGVVALPTETVYGLTARALDPEAVAKIFAVKERPAFDPLIVHVWNLEGARAVAEWPTETAVVLEKLARAFWPGPLTLVLPKKSVVPDIVTSGLPTVAVRAPSHPVFRRVLKACGEPLAAPSANRFGRISPTTASAVEKELGGRIPLILDGGACSEGLESTIIRVSQSADQKRPVIDILRAGPITREMLKPFGVVKAKAPVSAAPEAPGQLPSHYAPATPLRLLGPDEVFTPEPGKSYGWLALDGTPDPRRGLVPEAFDAMAVLSPGSGKLSEAAIRLFALLRQLDEAGVDELLAEAVPETGLGAAIMDRLRRAAAARRV